jgi:hypothetical protein
MLLRRSPPISVAGLVLALFSVAPAGAQPAAPLEYHAPEGCPDVQAFRDAIAARAVGAIDGEDAALRFRVDIARTDRGWHATAIATEGGEEQGRRELDVGESACEDVMEAIAFAVALLWSDLEERTASEVSDPHHAAIERPPAREAAAPAPIERGPEEPRDDDARFELGAHATVGAGALPGAGVGGALVPSLALDRWRFALEARALAGVGGRSALDEPLETAMATLGPAFCAREGVFLGCAAARLGAAWGIAPSVAQPRLGVAFFASLAVAAGFRLEIVPGLEVETALELELPLTPLSFDVGGRTLWSSSWLSGGVRAGIAIAP